MSKKPITVNDIKVALEKAVPAQLQESWDNSGLLVGFEKRQVSRVLTCLEITSQVIEEALSLGAEMIITHHPFIFGSISNISENNPKGADIIRVIQNGISVYSCHTPFDKVSGGNNDALCKVLGLTDVTDLAGNKVVSAEKMLQNPSLMHIGRIGKLKKPIKFSQVIDFVCDGLGLELSQLAVVGDLDREITKIGLCTGAGAEFIEAAAAEGAECFVTGDLKYHAAMDAKAIDMCVIDAGHYGTEQLFGAVMQVYLENILDSSVEVIASRVDINPFKVFVSV